RDQAVRREVVTGSQSDLPRFEVPKAIDEHRSRRRSATHRSLAALEIDDAPDLRHEDALVWNTSRPGEIPVERHMTVLAVDRERVQRSHQLQHLLQFVASRVAGNMDPTFGPTEDDVRS